MAASDVELVVTDDPIRVAAEHLAAAVTRGGEIALSGGSSPRPAYRLAARLGSPRKRARDAEREAAALRLAGRLWRTSDGPCLERSLALFRELGRLGASPELVCGMAQESGTLVGHAWVEVDGRRLLEPEANEQRFTTVMRFGPDGLLGAPGQGS